MSSPRTSYRYRGFVWPAVLILVGVFALLVDANVISTDRLYRLADLWPLLLIVIGLELIIRRTPMNATMSAAATLLIVLIAAGGAVVYVAVGPATPGGTHTLDASEPAAGLQQAALQVDVGAATLHISGSDSLGADLFRAHIKYRGAKPTVKLDPSSGLVEISQNSAFQLFGSQRFVLDLQVSTSVPWGIAVNSGAATDTFDFSSINVSSIELNTGASREDITLGPPQGSVSVTINGGALTVNLHRPPGAGAGVNVSGGAVNLTFDGRSQHAIGSASASTGSEADMYDVQVNGGACTVTMDTNVPSI